MKEVLNFLEINSIDFDTIINKHRNEEIWRGKKEMDGD